MDRDKLIMEWTAAKAELDRAKARELECRHALCGQVFPDAPKEGTTTVDLGAGYKLKLVTKFNYNLSATDTDAALDAIAASGNEGTFIADRLVTWKPALSIREYRGLSPAHRTMIDEALTITEAAPALELIEPKK
jgi:hypothetical protein